MFYIDYYIDPETSDEMLQYRNTRTHYYNEDSVVNFINYQKIYFYRDELGMGEVEFAGLIREEEKKTYFIYPSQEKETLMYDFSLETGDSIALYDYWLQAYLDTFLVVNTEFIEINNIPRKKIDLALNWNKSLIVYTWIEYIGSDYGLFYPLNMVSGGARTLLCFYEDDELIYKNPKYSECFYEGDFPTGIHDIIPTDKKPILYPNPVENILHIKGDTEVRKVEIFDISGKRVLQQSFEGDKTITEINVAQLDRGTYIVRIFNRQRNNIGNTKFIKK